MPTFTRESILPFPAKDVFAWHQSPGALAALIPPWENISVEKEPRSLGDGELAVLVLRRGPLRLRWIAEHRGLTNRGDGGGEFTDIQLSGPFRSWTHRHIVTARDPASCTLLDHIEFSLPLGSLGWFVAGAYVRRSLERTFAYRHDATRAAMVSWSAEQRRPSP